MSREALVLLVCCCDFRDGAERLIPSKSLRNAVIWAFPGLLCILRMCAPRRAAAVVRPRGHETSADRRRRILISRLLIIRASVPRRKSPFPAYFKGFPAVSPLIPPYPAFLKYPVSPQPLPLILTPNNVLGSTVESVSGSGAGRTGDTSYATKTAMFCERVVQGRRFVISTACRKSRNLGFWLFFWSLLEQRPKVTRARRHGIFQNGRTELSAPTTV